MHEIFTCIGIRGEAVEWPVDAVHIGDGGRLGGPGYDRSGEWTRSPEIQHEVPAWDVTALAPAVWFLLEAGGVLDPDGFQAHNFRITPISTSPLATKRASSPRA